MSEDMRPVWLTREQRDLIDSFDVDGLDSWAPDIQAITAAWDAAPADPVELIEEILNRSRIPYFDPITRRSEAEQIARALGLRAS